MFNLKRPCFNCPFKNDISPYLHPKRIEELTEALLEGSSGFACHNTNEFNIDGNPIVTDKSETCAGAMIFLEHQNKPHVGMQIGERVGVFDPDALDMDSPVYRSSEEMIHAAREQEKRENDRASSL